MRLGAYPAKLEARKLTGQRGALRQVNWSADRHRHRYEVNNAYREPLEAAGLRLSGISPDSRLVEFIELDRSVHPFFVATQAHPELKSRPTRPHPLFVGLIGAALARQRSERLEVEDGVEPAHAPRTLLAAAGTAR